MKKIQVLIAFLCAVFMAAAETYTQYVDPKIGSEGLGRVYIGPCMPYGMIKPSPDGVSMPNSGWAPMPEAIKGFSQVHVSGTGGGQKYGNVLIMPVSGPCLRPWAVSEVREDETISLGYYATQLHNGINVEITSAARAAIYRIKYEGANTPGLVVDAGAFLGMSDVPDQRETQMLVGSQIEVVSDTEIKGYNRVRGGWNNGRAYTVYFYLVSDKPFTNISTWKGDKLSNQIWQTDSHQPTGALLRYQKGTETVKIKVGISYISELKARDNVMTEIPGYDFDGVYRKSLAEWDKLLNRIEIAPSATDEQRRMLYTGLYHTMIMPTDRSGENPLWADDTPYYDDFYAIWDTYRTSSPMITLIDERREIDIVNSLLNIYKRDGYLPDARSGNANGRTQGGSNAEIVIADALAKRLEGIDYEYALEAMLKDADVPPGGNEEAEGRGGLVEYNTLGYVPFGIPRAGNRTIEYSYCDYAIAQVAKAVGRDDLYDRFMKQSGRWKNLWRDDYEHAGVHGFIMPRTREGEWLDSLPQGHSTLRQPKYEYTAMTFEGPWYTPWWSMFFYEAPSWEYSLSIPHDVPGLIEKCGGAETFERRLDTFFDQGFYNVNNEPSFLSPCLYHWIGKPWRSTDRVHQIVSENFGDTGMGLPGNDDSGAMSSWLAFHLLGLYPNAGQDYYLINTPMLEGATLHLKDSKDFTIATEGFSPENKYIIAASLNGEPYPYSSIRHSDIIRGGTLTLTLGDKPGEWGRELAPSEEIQTIEKAISPTNLNDLTFNKNSIESQQLGSETSTSLTFVFKLHGQTRRYKMCFTPLPDGAVKVTWGIERNLKWQQGSYQMTPEAVAHGSMLDLSMPIDGAEVALPSDVTSYIISRKAFDTLKQTGSMRYDNTDYHLVDADAPTTEYGLLHVREDAEGCEMWILDNPHLPIVWAMQGNPLEVNYYVQSAKE